MLNYLADRRETDVVRWHARRVVQRETLAEHHGRTARTTLALCRALHRLGIAQPDTLTAVAMAMAHDAPEVVLGDMPGLAKVLHPPIKAALQHAEVAVISELYADLPPPMRCQYEAEARRIAAPAPDDLEAQVVTYADRFEAWAFIQDEIRLGNGSIRDPRNDTEATTTAALAKMQWPWLRRLRAATDLP